MEAVLYYQPFRRESNQDMTILTVAKHCLRVGTPSIRGKFEEVYPPNQKVGPPDHQVGPPNDQVGPPGLRVEAPND